MSMIPWRTSYPGWMDWDMMDSPSRVFDQFFGMPRSVGHGMLTPQMAQGMMPYWMGRGMQGVGGPETGMSEVVNDKDKFQINLDVSHFKPEEIKVKTTAEGNLVIAGTHEERQDPHGYVSRQFTRKYVLPKSVDPQTVVSHLSHEGTLTIQAPKKQAEVEGERVIPIQAAPKCPAVEAKK